MQKIFVMFSVLGLLVAVAVSCNKSSNFDTAYYTDKAACTTDSISYSGTVKAILNNSCAYSGCHSTKSKEAGVVLDTYSSAKNEFVNGTALCTINHDCNPMPQGGSKLSDAVIQQLTCWAKNGCKE